MLESDTKKVARALRENSCPSGEGRGASGGGLTQACDSIDCRRHTTKLRCEKIQRSVTNSRKRCSSSKHERVIREANEEAIVVVEVVQVVDLYYNILVKNSNNITAPHLELIHTCS